MFLCFAVISLNVTWGMNLNNSFASEMAGRNKTSVCYGTLPNAGGCCGCKKSNDEK